MSLDIVITNSDLNENVDDKHFWTGQRIEFDEWRELFENVLHAPVEIERFENESGNELLERREKLFKEHLAGKGYRMLGRVWYIFRDAFYAPAEVNKLLEECLNIQRKTENEQTVAALEKLVFACDEALKAKSGIMLGCD
jgi:hypothetical protein